MLRQTRPVCTSGGPRNTVPVEARAGGGGPGASSTPGTGRGPSLLYGARAAMVLCPPARSVMSTAATTTGTSAPPLNALLYESLVVRSIAAILLVVGLAPPQPRPFSWRTMLIALAAFGALSGLAVAAANALPRLVRIDSLEVAAARGATPWPWVT